MRLRRLAWLALPLLLFGGGCAKKKKVPFTCERFQKRTERCQRYLFLAIDLKVASRVSTGDIEPDEQKDEQRRYKTRLARSIRANGAKKLCERAQKQASRQDRKRFTNMKFCYSRGDCEAFARCSLGIW